MPRSHAIDYGFTDDVFDNPSLNLCINRSYLPLLTGVLEVLTLPDYWPSGTEFVGPGIIDRLIDRLNHKDYKLDCNTDGEPTSISDLWCFAFDFHASDGGWVGLDRGCDDPAKGSTTRWGSTPGWFGTVYDTGVECPGESHNSQSILDIVLDTFTAYELREITVVGHKPTNNSYGGTLSIFVGASQHDFTVPNDYTVEFAISSTGVTHLKIEQGAGLNPVGSGLDRPCSIEQVIIRGVGVNPFESSNCTG